jgi:hypothetical protein
MTSKERMVEKRTMNRRGMGKPSGAILDSGV